MDSKQKRKTWKKSELIEFVRNICEYKHLELIENSERYFKISTDHASGISIIIEFDESNKLDFYFLQRTHDIFYNGDRTDAHVVLSLMFASFLRLSGMNMSVYLFDIPHPILEDEVWGRYIMPGQAPSFFGISDDDQLFEKIYNIICIVSTWRQLFWRFVGCPCDKCIAKDSINNQRNYVDQYHLAESLEKLYGTSRHKNFGGRMRPNWNYVYDIENEVTLIESNELSDFLQYILEKSKFPKSRIDGISGELIVDSEINHFINFGTKKELNDLIRILNCQSDLVRPILPLENMLITVSKPYIIALGRLSGNREFITERELVRNRHNRESEILFPITSFDWVSDPCPNQFENLIKALLERETNVKQVRKPAPINQGDKGRDLVIEWNIIDKGSASEAHPPTRLIRVVGQCKSGNKTVGKGKVLDIRDTIETHNSAGFFLAVSTQISASLTEKLELLQNQGIWTHWWNRDEIESRLLNNQDLLPDFTKVVLVKNKIKFVDKD